VDDLRPLNPKVLSASFAFSLPPPRLLHSMHRLSCPPVPSRTIPRPLLCLSQPALPYFLFLPRPLSRANALLHQLVYIIYTFNIYKVLVYEA
jgi:hypothetical protein